jgi:hypothetical protein
MRAIHFAVVVEVVLAVVFLTEYAAALLILRVLDMGTFPMRHHTIGFGAVFHILYMLLTAFQTGGFALGQRTRFFTLLDPSFLVFLAPVGARRAFGGRGHSRARQQGCKGGAHQ